MATITKKQFFDAAATYALARVVTTPGACNPSKVQWGFAEAHGIDVVDDREYVSADAAMRAAEHWARNDKSIWAAAVADAREWTRYNGHTING